jgi:cytochrome c peroxidase
MAQARSVLAGCLLLACAAPALADPAPEIARILSLGPWPAPAARDPSNRASGRPEAIALGERFFFSPRLSGAGGLLCASCHEPWRGYTDGRPRALGLAFVDRNTPTLANVRLNRWFGWDGANDNLWSQSIRPMLDPREMNSSPEKIAALVRGDPSLSAGYEKAFGEKPPANDEAVLAGVGKALAAYQETLSTGRTPFDDFRDALARGDAQAVRSYPAQALRGLRIFAGRGNCATCHSGPNFSDGAFHRAGVESKRQDGEPDRGREEGVRKLLANRFNLLGPYNDDPARATAAGTRMAAGEADIAGAFRTPGLRNVALSAPYLHDGSAASLCEAIARHPAPPARLSSTEKNDLVAFLATLTEAGSRAPAPEALPCP